MSAETQAGVEVHLGIEDGESDPLQVVSGIAEGIRTIDAVLREWVAKARAGGATWQQVADALKVTRQSAWERFGKRSEADDVIDSIRGRFAGLGGPTTDEMREMARREEEEIEERKWGRFKK